MEDLELDGYSKGYRLTYLVEDTLYICNECGKLIQDKNTRFWVADGDISIICDDCHDRL